MRKAFCDSLVKNTKNENFVFLTGDLGFMALEPLRESLGNRFINAGVSEQNMVSVAAGLASQGLRPWAYSIAPFIFARPFEQIRNDVCLHALPVVLVGNGGGYGYGVMGATHHALEDYGSLLTLPGMQAFIPIFDEDIPFIIEKLFENHGPGYLRLGLSEKPENYLVPEYKPWRNLLDGNGPTILIVGSLAGGLLKNFSSLKKTERPSIWALTELPFHDVPVEFLADISRSQNLCVIEEHTSHGGVGQMVAHFLMLKGTVPKKYSTRNSIGYPSGKYGSQKYHRKECGLDFDSIRNHLAC